MHILKDYSRIIHLIDQIEVDKVYPLSIVEETQQGEVWVDNLKNPRCVLFWHYCGFGYIAGEYDEGIITEIKEMIHNPSVGHLERLALQTGVDEKLESMIMSDKTIKQKKQYLFEFMGNNQKEVNILEKGVELQRINYQNYKFLSGHIVPSFSWNSMEQFLSNGFGYCILKEGKFVACAFSSGMSKEYVDIGVETSPDYRGQGYAKLVSNAMITEILRTNRTPVWECNETNEASRRLACSVGFKTKGVHPLYLI